jgi:hypothetical protein
MMPVSWNRKRGTMRASMATLWNRNSIQRMEIRSLQAQFSGSEMAARLSMYRQDIKSLVFTRVQK